MTRKARTERCVLSRCVQSPRTRAGSRRICIRADSPMGPGSFSPTRSKDRSYFDRLQLDSIRGKRRMNFRRSLGAPSLEFRRANVESSAARVSRGIFGSLCRFYLSPVSGPLLLYIFLCCRRVTVTWLRGAQPGARARERPTWPVSFDRGRCTVNVSNSRR